MNDKNVARLNELRTKRDSEGGLNINEQVELDGLEKLAAKGWLTEEEKSRLAQEPETAGLGAKTEKVYPEGATVKAPEA